MELDFSPVIASARYLIEGLQLTVLLSLLTILLSALFGGVLGLTRSYGPSWLRWPIPQRPPARRTAVRRERLPPAAS